MKKMLKPITAALSNSEYPYFDDGRTFWDVMLPNKRKIVMFATFEEMNELLDEGSIEFFWNFVVFTPDDFRK